MARTPFLGLAHITHDESVVRLQGLLEVPHRPLRQMGERFASRPPCQHTASSPPLGEVVAHPQELPARLPPLAWFLQHEQDGGLGGEDGPGRQRRPKAHPENPRHVDRKSLPLATVVY